MKPRQRDTHPRPTDVPELVIWRSYDHWKVGHLRGKTTFVSTRGDIGRFRRLRDAQSGAAHMGRLVDWTLPEEAIRERVTVLDVLRALRMVELDYFGPVLRAVRELRYLEQQEAARRAGITKAMLSTYETGHRLPSLPTFYALVLGLGIDLRKWQRAMRAAVYEEPGAFRAALQ